MVFIQGLTIFRVGEPVRVENLSTPGFDEYVLSTIQGQNENIIDPQFLPDEQVLYSYQSEGVRQLKLTATKTVEGLPFTLQKSVTFDVGYAPDFSLLFQKSEDQSADYNFNYVALGVCFGVDVFQGTVASSPTTYSWNYGGAITFSSPTDANQILKHSSLGVKNLGLTISNRFGTGNSEIEIKCIDTPILGITVSPDYGQFQTNESIEISRYFISGNGHGSSDVSTYFVIQGVTYDPSSVVLQFGQTGYAGITLYFQSLILTGLSGTTYKEYEIVENLNPYIIHVSGITGNDSWSGEYANVIGSSGPVKTLNRAAELASLYTGIKNVEVQIQSGTYRFLEQSFYLNSSNSGIDKTITYKPYLNSEVIISGGYTVSPSLFTLVTAGNTLIYDRLKTEARGNVFGADLSSLGISFGDVLPDVWSGSGIVNKRLPSLPELYYNGNKMTLARWPNKFDSSDDSENDLEYHTTAKIDFNYRQGKITNNSGVTLNAIFGYTSGHNSTINRWSVTGPNSFEGIWLQGFWKWDWNDEVMKVVSIDKTNRRIEVSSLNALRQPVYWKCPGTPIPINPPHPNGNGLEYTSYSSNSSLRRWYAFNLLEELDSPGEYYIDRYNKKVYFWPPTQISGTADIVLSSIRLSGDNSWVPGTSTQWAQNRDLHYTVPENTRDAYASLFKFFRLKNTIISGLIFRNISGSGLELNMCENVTIKNCKIYSPRKNGIVIMGGKNNIIDDCEIYHSGLHGVVLGGGDRQQLIPANNTLKNSKIIGSGKNTPSWGRGVFLTGIGNVIRKNIFAEIFGIAIIFHGNDHVIEYNNFTNIMGGLDDMGGIYNANNLSDRGTIIKYNFFNNVKSGLSGQSSLRRIDESNPCTATICFPDSIHLASAIYLDAFSSGTTIKSNVFYNSGSDAAVLGSAINYNMGIDNHVNNNIFIDVPTAVMAANATKVMWEETYREALKSGIDNINLGPLQSIKNVDNDPWYENGGPESLVSYDYSPYSFYGSVYGSEGTFRSTKGLMNKVDITSSQWVSKYPELAGPNGLIRYDADQYRLYLNLSYQMKNYNTDNVIINQHLNVPTFYLYKPYNTPSTCGGSNYYLASFDTAAYLTGGTELYSLFVDKANLNFKLTTAGLNQIKQSIPNFVDIPFEQIPTYP